MDRFDAEMHAAALAGSPYYRILRKLEPREMYPWPIQNTAKIGVLVDVETTGLDPSKDEIIELGMLRFAYSATGTILGPVAGYQAFREPSKAIPDHITRLTGISNDMCVGHRIEVKDRLRERGYRWNVGDDGRPRAWHMEVYPDQVEAEVAFLDSLGFPDQIEPLVTEVDALIRFSDRLFCPPDPGLAAVPGRCRRHEGRRGRRPDTGPSPYRRNCRSDRRRRCRVSCGRPPDRPSTADPNR